jgi:hypothetical protein
MFGAFNKGIKSGINLGFRSGYNPLMKQALILIFEMKYKNFHH